MSVVSTTGRPAATVADWLRPRLRRITVPSWLVSGVLHWGVFLAAMSLSDLPGCQPDMAGEGGESLREVGIYLRPAIVPEPEDGEPEPAEDAVEPPQVANVVVASPAPAAVPDRPPVNLHLPTLDAPPLIGAGGPPRTTAGMDQLLSPTRSGPGAPVKGGGGPQGTSLFGIQDAGQRFVYVIDSSSSMGNFNALRVAKGELLGSLERLTPEQQFQVLFCNSAQVLKLDAGRFGMFFGTDSQRLEVSLQIAGIAPDAGTEHRQALLQAIALNPDVIFYLTDAGEPFLLSKDLEEIRRKNRGARIHCIHFGEGSPLTDASGQPAGNFLTTLASQNNGKYTYRDVRQFVRR